MNVLYRHCGPRTVHPLSGTSALRPIGTVATTAACNTRYGTQQAALPSQRSTVCSPFTSPSRSTGSLIWQAPQKREQRRGMSTRAMTTPDKELEPVVDADFTGAIPKEEIGALRLLEKHPEYDGRGCTIAIFDTGVDPAAAGLATTSEGKPKIVDIVDGTGSGDVDTSHVVETGADGVTLQGLHGTALAINPDWKNPSGKWRVGAKPVFELYPGGCKSRMTQRRKDKWQEKQDAALAAAITDLAAFSTAGLSSAEQKQRKAELEARVALLEGHASGYADAGPQLHCVVWHDGDAWRAAIDTHELHAPDSQEGLLADFTPMTNFRAARQYATFSALDACNYCVNIYDGGDTLSVVTDVGAHGTHVAGIAAACMRHDGEDAATAPFDGVAPGAQIVSCKIGDTRVGGMETGPGLSRALAAVLDNKCDVINMSYGEPTMTPNQGRIVDLINEVVRDAGVIFVASAGNNGPGLTTVGAPGGTSASIMSIGAYVSPSSAAAVHSHPVGALPDGWEGQQYNWSSRGPVADGDTGVSFCAPGGAIAPVPQWCQQRRQLMNGTSMSAPCAAGGVALVVSALKQAGAAVTPSRVRRAIENTARQIHTSPLDTLAYGRGLMQVDKAIEYLLRAEDVDVPDRRIDVSVRRTEGNAGGRGIYLRDAAAAAAPADFAVTFRPQLHRDADVRAEKLAIEERLALRSTAPWVTAPASLLLPHNGRQVDVHVDAGGLEEGVHYAEVEAWDMAAEWRGPLARVPVTVCIAKRPQWDELDPSSAGLNVSLGEMQFHPGQEHRHFVHVPPGASWAELRLTAAAHATPKLFLVHTTQILPHTRPQQSRHNLSVTTSSTACVTFPVTPGASLEVALAQFWKTSRETLLAAELAFHGVVPAGGHVALLGQAHSALVMVHAPLRLTKLAPKATLDKLTIPLRPTESKLVALQPDAPAAAADGGEAPPATPNRDALPRGRVMHRLLLTYKLSLAEGGTITPVLPPLRAAVYDGALEGQVYAVYDSNKKRLSFGDVYPADVTVPKGDYTIHVALRHDVPKVLEGLRQMVLAVERKVDPAITVPCHSSLQNAITGGKAISNATLRIGERMACYVGPVPGDGLPKDAKPGCTMHGSLKLAKTSPLAGDKAAPNSATLLYTVPPAKKKADDDAEKAAVEEEPAEALKHARRAADVKILKGLKSGTAAEREAYDALRQELRAAHPDHLPIFLEGLKRAAGKVKQPYGPDAGTAADSKEFTATADAADGEPAAATSAPESAPAAAESQEEACRAVLAAADEVVALVDEVEVARYMAWKDKPETAEERKHKETMKEQKGALIDALHHKCKALDVLCKLSPDAAEPDSRRGELDTALKELSKWVDITAVEYVGLHASREVALGRPAGAVKALDKVLNDKEKQAPKEIWEQKAALLRSLGWHHWADNLHSATLQAFPGDYARL
eukprot:jgi/Ulvmu1/131/UM001_0135.1